MTVKVTNNGFSTLSAGITDSATTITLASGEGSRFPTLSTDDYFYGTLIDTSNNLEIVKVTARSTDSLTVVRAQDNTSARAFSTGDRFELRPVAKLFEDIATDGPSFSARISSTQTVSANTFTKMACATEDWDTDSKYDASTNYRFTPTVAGYYHFDIGMRGSSSTINIIALYKNGAIWKRKIVEGHKYAQLSILVVSDTDDYFEAYGYTSGTSFDATDTNNWFQAHFVRGV